MFKCMRVSVLHITKGHVSHQLCKVHYHQILLLLVEHRASMKSSSYPLELVP